MIRMVTVLILNTGSIMNIGFEKVYLMQSSLNLPVSEVISTYVYKIGILSTDYSLATTILSVGMALCAQESIKEKRMVLLEEVLGKEEDRQ